MLSSNKPCLQSDTPAPKSPTLVTKILTFNSPTLIPVPPNPELKRASFQGPLVGFKKQNESTSQIKSDEEMFNAFDGFNKKVERNIEQKATQRSSMRKSHTNLNKEPPGKNSDVGSPELLKRGSIIIGVLAETLDIPLTLNKDNSTPNKTLAKSNEGYSIKKNLMDSSHLSASRFKLSKQHSISVKEGSGTQSPNEGLFDPTSDSFSRSDGKVLLSSTMRRRSCHCSDCGGMSAMEKKHINIVLPCKRVQTRVGISLSLKYPEYQVNSNTQSQSPIQSTPRHRAPKSIQEPSSQLSVQSSGSSKKFLTAVPNNDKDKVMSNLSRFAAVSKRSFTTQVQFEESQQIIPSRSVIDNNNRSRIENPLDDDELMHHTITAGSDMSVKTPARASGNSKESEEHQSTQLKRVPSLDPLNVLEFEKEKKIVIRPRKRSSGEFIVDSLSPINIASPKNVSTPKQFKPPLLVNVLSTRKLMVKSQLSPTEAIEPVQIDSPQYLGHNFSRKVEKATKKPRNDLKLRNLSILETYNNHMQIQSPQSAHSKTVQKQSLMESLETASSALSRTPDSQPRTPIKSKLLNMTSKKLNIESKSTFYMRSNSQSGGSFLPNLGTSGFQKDIKSHREDLFKNPFKLEASEDAIFRLKKKRGLSTDVVERAKEELNAAKPVDFEGKTKKKVFKSKHRKNKSNPIMLEEIKKAYQPGLYNKGKDIVV